jgi:opacity protein-like surface antigen
MAETRREAPVAGSRLSLLLVVTILGIASRAEAQLAPFTGMLTGHLGASHAGDVRDATVTGGASLAVVDENGLGAELDIAHFGDFDDELFADSSVTNFMLNFVAIYPNDRLRPFLAVGVGGVRLSAAPATGQPSSSHTEGAWDAGGGLLFMANEIFGVRADVRYFRLFTRIEDLALRDDGFFDFWRTSVGVTFTWPIR